MGSENLNPLDELKTLDQQVDQATELAELKPIFHRLDEISKEYSGDFDIQLAVDDLKQKVVDRGKKLKEQQPVRASSIGQFATPARMTVHPAKAPEPPSAPPPIPAQPPAVSGPNSTLESPSAAVSTESIQSDSLTTLPLVPAPEPAAAKAPPKGGKPAPGTQNWKRALGMGALIGAVLSLIVIAIVVNLARKRNAELLAGQVGVVIATTPPGASIQVNGQEVCRSDCTAQLAPGTYQVTAVRDGYEPAASEIRLVKDQPASLSLTLTALPQSLRIYADLNQGQVLLDGKPAGQLQNGQFVLERVTPGPHSIHVTGTVSSTTGGTVTNTPSEASFSFDLADAKLPAVTGTVTTRNLLAVIVSSFANQARVVTSAGPMKLVVNGQAESDAGPAGVDLKSHAPGATQIVLGEGALQRTLEENLGPAPALTAFLKTDQNIGTLVVTADQNDVRVFLNDKENTRITQRGQARISTIGRVTVKVTKEGYEEPAPKTVTVAKGSETRVDFKLKALPEFSSLEITGGTPGAEVLIDNIVVGTISGEGRFRHGSVSPGDRKIEIRLEEHEPKTFDRNFRRGQAVTISGADPVLVAIRKEEPPPPAAPPPPKPEPPPVKVVSAPKPRVGTMANFDNPGAWREQDGVWRHRGSGFLTYNLPANGVFSFTIHLLRGGNVFRGGRVKWMVDFKDARNYAFFEMDDQSLWSKVEQNGETFERTKVDHKVPKGRAWNIQVDVNPQRVITRVLREGEWVVVDTWNEPARDFSDGKFGILVTGNDEVGLSDFQYIGR